MAKIEKQIDKLREHVRKQIPEIRKLIEINKKILKLYEETSNEELLRIHQAIINSTNMLTYQNNELFHCYEKFCLLTY